MDSPKMSACDATESKGLLSENAGNSALDAELKDLEGRMGTESDYWDSEYSEGSEGWMGTESDDWDSDDSANQSKDSKRRMVMRLHIVRGSFFTVSADLEEWCPSMEADLWSMLPEEIMWRVVQFVPAAKHFQLQSVSRKWRQVLTSADFRNAIAAAPRELEEEQRVITCASPCGTRRSRKLKALDIDLASFVPSGFWKPDGSYSVVAAAKGLLCISNDNRFDGLPEAEASTTQYGVVNPLTRTCIVLPKLPFQPGQWLLPSTTTTLTICDIVRQGTDSWEVATFDLAAGGEWEVAAYRLVDPLPEFWVPAALCAGKTYLYNHGKAHLLAPCPGPDGLPVDSLDAPSVTLLGLDDASLGFNHNDVFLVAHRSTLFFVARTRNFDLTLRFKPRGTYFDNDVVCGVWRLARDRMEWEAVARLDLQELERLASLGCGKSEYDCGFARVVGACGVREFLCLQVVVNSGNSSIFVLGFDLDRGTWELVHHERWVVQEKLPKVHMLELRPDLFLSGDVQEEMNASKEAEGPPGR